ncbi:6293_t:CDS:2 [Funneliformis geosporum]|uniref:9647_t:CDS:1 n=1 Tax=Funneliformis geosporum TaxID=1117311 RepID=A0A9W4T4W2_9GLOM|nr:6293_t:CDS:2 [Funneliformis geosporum]CAI2192686.1 9647_t:CDS:2 [Funneliformis geosporum]
MSANEEIVESSRLSVEGIITPKNHNLPIIQIDEDKHYTKELDPIHEKIINVCYFIGNYTFATKRDWILMGIFAIAVAAAIPAVARVRKNRLCY